MAVFSGGFKASKADAGPSAAATPVDELIAALRDDRDRKKQLDAMDQLAVTAGGMNSADQMRVVYALGEAYDSPINEGGVRGRALDTLGKCAAWFSDETAVRRAVEVLTQAAAVTEPDQRVGLKLYAMLGLSRTAGHLPRGDQGTEKLVIAAALDGLRDSRMAQEKLAAMMTLHAYEQTRGAGQIAFDQTLARRFDDELLRPYQGNIDALYNDDKNTLDYRWLYIRSIDIAAWSVPVQPEWRSRIGQIMRDISYRETDSRLKEIARLYAQRLDR